MDTSSYKNWCNRQYSWIDSMMLLDTAQRLNAVKVKVLQELAFPRLDGHKSLLISDGDVVEPMGDTTKFLSWWNTFLPSRQLNVAAFMDRLDGSSGIISCKPPSPMIIFTTDTRNRQPSKKRSHKRR